MFIVVVNGPDDLSSNPNTNMFVFHIALMPLGMYDTQVSKLLSNLGSLIFVCQPV